MIYAQINKPFEAIATQAPTGLLPNNITVEVYDPTDGVAVVAATSAGITMPRPGTYRVELTAPTIGTYMVRWTANGSIAAEEYLVVGTLPAATSGEYLPGVSDVADLIPSRTRTRGGVLVHTFNADTLPTEERVMRLLSKANDYVVGRVGVVTDPALASVVSKLIAIYAAMLVELGYYPEQVNSDKSAYPELKKLFDEGMLSLIESLGGEGGSVVDEPSLSAIAFYDFPPTAIGDGIMP